MLAVVDERLGTIEAVPSKRKRESMTSTPRMMPLVLTLLLGASFAACGGDDPSGPGTATVNVDDDFFDPSSRTVSAGTTVQWTWIGGNTHNVTFDDGVGNSVTQTSGTHSRRLNQTGTFPYICTIHGRAVMSGEIVVQ